MWIKKTVVLSANNTLDSLFKALHKLLLWIENNSGSRTEPWGTPQVVMQKEELR